MISETLNFTGTKEYLAIKLRQLCYGMTAYIFYIIVVGAFAWLSPRNDLRPPVIIALLIVFLLHVIDRFLTERLENDKSPLPSPAPLTAHFSADLARRLAPKRKVMMGDLLEASVRSKRGLFILEEMGVDAKVLLSRCKEEISATVDIFLFLADVIESLPILGETRIDANSILNLLFLHVPCCNKILEESDLSTDDLKGIIKWENFHYHFRVKDNPFSAESIKRTSSMGRSWVMGYTDGLDELTTQVNTEAATTGEKSVVIHEESIDNILRVLSRGTQRNVLILGKVGVGKRSIVEHVAWGLRSLEREQHLPFTRVLMLQTERLLSGVGSADTFLLNALGKAQGAGKFILVVKDLALLLKSSNTNLKAVILKVLQSRNFSIIGIADTQDYHTLIKNDPTLDSLFEKISVEDADEEETMRVLMAHYFAQERKHVRMTYRALKSIVDLSRRYMASKGGFPGKGIDVMDDAILRAREGGHAFVREEHVREVISLKSRVNVQRVTQGEKERLLNLDELMKKKVIGQDAAMRAVTSALKRARLDIHERKRPVGTFLFLGPTGVGKTQTAKVLAEEYFGSSDAIIRLDMNEFSHRDSVFGIIGSVGDGGEGFLAQRVQDKPFSLILLDEIEKAHPTVLNLFLQILDEGFLNDASGIRTDFRNTIIIATSNAGALFIRDFIREHQDFSKDDFKAALIETVLKEKLFAPEFINRFDEVVLFYPLSVETAAQVASLMLNEVINDVQKHRGVTVRVEDDVIGALVEHGYSVEFGAREMRRTVTEMIEDFLADYMLRNDVKRGDEIVIRKGDLKM